MDAVPIVVGALSVLSIVFFLVYIAGLLRLPTGHRPKTPTMNRYGEPLPPSENPGYEETEEEVHG